MKTQPQWETTRSIRVRFVDDQASYCNEVARIAENIQQESQGSKQVSVQCLRYVGALTSHQLTDVQKERVIVQLNAYHRDQDIPCHYEEQDVATAMQELHMEKTDGKIDDQQLFLKIREVAASKGYQF